MRKICLGFVCVLQVLGFPLYGAVCDMCKSRADSKPLCLYCTRCGEKIVLKSGTGGSSLIQADGYGIVCFAKHEDLTSGQPLYCELCGKQLSQKARDAAEFEGVLRETVIATAEVYGGEQNEPILNERKESEIAREKERFQIASGKVQSEMLEKARQDLSRVRELKELARRGQEQVRKVKADLKALKDSVSSHNAAELSRQGRRLFVNMTRAWRLGELLFRPALTVRQSEERA